MALDLSPSRTRVIERLRREFPGVWAYDRLEGAWKGPSFTVRAYSEDASLHDHDDRFVTTYRRSDTNEQVLPGHGRYHRS